MYTGKIEDTVTPDFPLWNKERRYLLLVRVRPKIPTDRNQKRTNDTTDLEHGRTRRESSSVRWRIEGKVKAVKGDKQGTEISAVRRVLRRGSRLILAAIISSWEGGKKKIFTLFRLVSGLKLLYYIKRRTPLFFGHYFLCITRQ